MLFCPHEDDELLMTAGVIHRAVQSGDSVYVNIVTNGEYEGEDISALRLQESIRTLTTLGVPRENIQFFGYSDTGMEYEVSFLYRLYFGEEGLLVPSKFGRTETFVPAEFPEYHMARFGCHAPYTKASVAEDVYTALSDVMPDVIYAPCRVDRHGDHMALYRFVCDAVERARAEKDAAYKPELFQFLIHTYDDIAWPNRCPADAAEHLYLAPADIEKLGLDWDSRIVVPVPDDMKRGSRENLKYNILEMYETQHPHDYNEYIVSFAKDEEIFFKD